MTPSIDKQQATLAPRGLQRLETLVITLAFPVIGWIINPDDPLLLDSGLTWLLAIGPLLVGMRYGFALGFSSALVSVMLMGLEGWWYHGDWLADSSQRLPVAIALILVGMLAGEMADTWRRRLQQMTVVHQAQSTRLDEFIRHYQLLRVSHDQLAERLAANPFTLRDALKALEAKYQSLAPDDDVLRHHGSELLNFLALHARVQQAVLIPVDHRQQLQPDASTWFGGETDLTWHDPMLCACLEQRRMICLKSAMEQGINIDNAPLLAVVPLVDVEQRLYAVVAITAMPFIDFHRGHLHLLAVLGAQLGDMLKQTQHTLEGGNTDQRAVVARWVRHARDHQLISLLVTIDFSAQLGHDQTALAIDSIVSQQRGLDRSWVADRAGCSSRLYVLLPLTQPSAFAIYAERLKETLAAQPGIGEACQHVALSYQVIDGRLSARKLMLPNDQREAHHAHA
ncbi:PelD GGDEF domain-containing protein [Halomonas sp. CUBES01]|uniref:PelD GGDEF domain-containing protein n=1 Tax=Vreelandella gomseomensis TaxID=370766 RepID=A0ABU1GBG8_9GAMM|nr:MULTISPECIES: PelD GGDEF domain-containing protein [Halomonas]MDR5874418.1 PelD GGDEF domain-containing protein [Halomonas gomseomensis]MEC4765808.1 PelD GGDEF domain-containing protein [Halomonas sp. CUBES01]